MRARRSTNFARAVNTRFHDDRTDGNQLFAVTADIVARYDVREAILKLNVLQREPFRTSQLTNVPNRTNNPRSAGGGRPADRQGVS